MYRSDRDATRVPTPSTSSSPCTVEIIPRHLRLINISETELRALASGSNSTDLTFFGICFGATVAFGIVLYSGGISDVQQATYKMLLCAAIVLSSYFGVQSIRNYRQSKRNLKDLGKASK